MTANDRKIKARSVHKPRAICDVHMPSDVLHSAIYRFACTCDETGVFAWDPRNKPHMATLELCAGFPSCLIQGGRKLTQSLRITILSPPGRPLDGLVWCPAGILGRLEASCAPLGALLSCLSPFGEPFHEGDLRWPRRHTLTHIPPRSRKRGGKKISKRSRGHEEEKEGATSSNGNR